MSSDKTLFYIILVIGLLSAGVFYLCRTVPYFGIADIRFYGLEHLDRARLLKLSKISPGDNIFAADLDAYKDSLLKEPWILEVEVIRNIPSTISVRIRERVPSFLVKKNGYYLLSADGVVLEGFSEFLESEYFVISGELGGSVSAGVNLFLRFPNLRKLVYTLAQKELLERFNELRLSKKNGWVLFSSKPEYKILLGNEKIGERFSNFLLVMDDIERRQPIEHVDLRFRNMVVLSSGL